jgi:hypothetical protein
MKKMTIPFIKLHIIGNAFGLYSEYSNLLDFEIKLISNIPIILKTDYDIAYNDYLNFKNNREFEINSYFSIFEIMKYNLLLKKMDVVDYGVFNMKDIEIVCNQEIIKSRAIIETCDYICDNDEYGMTNLIIRLGFLIKDIEQYNKSLPDFFRKKFPENFI